MHEYTHMCIHVCRHTNMNPYVYMYGLIDVGGHVCMYICMYAWIDG